MIAPIRPLIGLTLLLVAFSGVRAQSEVGLLPGDKEPVVLRPDERNPFAKREEKLEILDVADDTESEENRIRAILLQLQVVGRTRGTDGRKVLLDDLILEEGKLLPPLVAGQTEQLKVQAIYDSAVEIVWVEADPNSEPRRLFIPVRLQPEVGRALGGRSVNPATPTVTTDAPAPLTDAPADL